MTTFQRIALTAFLCLEVLIFVGAAVRASGSGLGCPDWPFCYGCLVPPTTAEAIDFTKLDLEKFRHKAAQHGRDPFTITAESLRAEFDPVATWIEYLNRLTSLPVSLSVLGMLLYSFRQRIRVVRWTSLGAFVLLLANAWLGARVVLSGLKPGTITLHMGLAILMQCVLVFTVWRGTENPWHFSASLKTVQAAAGLFLLVVIEGIMGSQVRELTDELARTHAGEARSVWVGELEQSLVYLVHRSFSWIIVITAGLFYFWAARPTWLERVILGLVLAQMSLGILLARVGILAVAQILHIGLSSLLVSALCLWWLGSRRSVHPTLSAQ
ncbi:MAG: COX15/CtaA family protein [Verrucomicrobiales bacterium]